MANFDDGMESQLSDLILGSLSTGPGLLFD